MEAAVRDRRLFSFFRKNNKTESKVDCLADGKTNILYTVKALNTDDQAMIDFLFTLGCYEGEEVTIISRLADNIVISIKDARYSINTELAKVIEV